MKALLWTLAGMGAGLIGLALIPSIIAERPPNWLTLALLSCAFAVLPYCFGSALNAAVLPQKRQRERNESRARTLMEYVVEHFA